MYQDLGFASMAFSSKFSLMKSKLAAPKLGSLTPAIKTFSPKMLTAQLAPAAPVQPVKPPVSSPTKKYLIIGGIAVAAGVGIWFLTRKKR